MPLAVPGSLILILAPFHILLSPCSLPILSGAPFLVLCLTSNYSGRPHRLICLLCPVRQMLSAPGVSRWEGPPSTRRPGRRGVYERRTEQNAAVQTGLFCPLQWATTGAAWPYWSSTREVAPDWPARGMCVCGGCRPTTNRIFTCIADGQSSETVPAPQPGRFCLGGIGGGVLKQKLEGSSAACA